MNSAPLKDSISLYDLLKRTEITISLLIEKGIIKDIFYAPRFGLYRKNTYLCSGKLVVATVM